MKNQDQLYLKMQRLLLSSEKYPLSFLIILLSIIFVCPSISFSANVKELYEQAVDAYNQQHYDVAIDAYNQIIAIVPSFAPAYNGIGLSIKARDEDLDEAIKYFQLALKNDPRYSQAYENLGRMYYSKGDYNQAQSNFEKALKIDPASVSSLSSLGWIHLLVKANPARAVKYFSKAYELNPNPNVYFALGMSYFSSNERTKAIDVVTRLREMHEEDLALKLERAMRESRKVNVEPVTTTRAEKPNHINPPLTSPTSSDTRGVKVRLRGKLEDLVDQ